MNENALAVFDKKVTTKGRSQYEVKEGFKRNDIKIKSYLLKQGVLHAVEKAVSRKYKVEAINFTTTCPLCGGKLDIFIGQSGYLMWVCCLNACDKKPFTCDLWIM